jgi:hypothetical protein
MEIGQLVSSPNSALASALKVLAHEGIYRSVC